MTTAWFRLLLAGLLLPAGPGVGGWDAAVPPTLDAPAKVREVAVTAQGRLLALVEARQPGQEVDGLWQCPSLGQERCTRLVPGRFWSVAAVGEGFVLLSRFGATLTEHAADGRQLAERELPRRGMRLSAQGSAVLFARVPHTAQEALLWRGEKGR